MDEEHFGTKPQNLKFTLKATERVKCNQTGILERLVEGTIDQEDGLETEVPSRKLLH